MHRFALIVAFLAVLPTARAAEAGAGATSIGGIVWFDSSRNGVQPDLPTGLAGVRVELLDASQALLADTTTDTAGAYSFDGLVPGATYHVRVLPPPTVSKRYASLKRSSKRNDLSPLAKLRRCAMAWKVAHTPSQ